MAVTISEPVKPVAGSSTANSRSEIRGLPFVRGEIVPWVEPHKFPDPLRIGLTVMFAEGIAVTSHDIISKPAPQVPAHVRVLTT